MCTNLVGDPIQTRNSACTENHAGAAFRQQARVASPIPLLAPVIATTLPLTADTCAPSFFGYIFLITISPPRIKGLTEHGARSATARVWLEHDTMGDDPDSGVAWPPRPGINGVRYGAQTGYLYYTSTAQKVFMRVPVDPVTLDPAGAPEFVAAIDKRRRLLHRRERRVRLPHTAPRQYL